MIICFVGILYVKNDGTGTYDVVINGSVFSNSSTVNSGGVLNNYLLL
jgi:hypothetical protein